MILNDYIIPILSREGCALGSQALQLMLNYPLQLILSSYVTEVIFHIPNRVLARNLSVITTLESLVFF